MSCILVAPFLFFSIEFARKKTPKPKSDSCLSLLSSSDCDRGIVVKRRPRRKSLKLKRRKLKKPSHPHRRPLQRHVSFEQSTIIGSKNRNLSVCVLVRVDTFVLGNQFIPQFGVVLGKM